MDLTIAEVVKKHGLNLIASWPETQAAFDEYAAQEAKSYQSWLSNQVLAGRTHHRLWMDYKTEILDQRPAEPAPSSSLLGEGPQNTEDKLLAKYAPCVVRADKNSSKWLLVREDDTAQHDEGQNMSFVNFEDEGMARWAAEIFNSQSALPAAPALLSSGGPAAKVIRWVVPELEMPKPWQKVECAVEEGDGSGWDHPQAGRTYHRLAYCEWNPGSETQQAGWYAKIGRTMERLPDGCKVRLWLSIPTEEVPTFALREKLLAAPVSISLGGGAAENPVRVVLEVLQDWLEENEATDFDENDVAHLFGMLGTAGYSILPNAKITQVNGLLDQSIESVSEGTAALEEAYQQVEQLEAFKAKFGKLWAEAREMAYTDYGAAWAHLAAAYDYADAVPADQLLVESSGAGWISVKERLPDLGQKVDFWQREHQMIGPGNLPDKIEAKAYSGWFDKGMLSYPEWSDTPINTSFYNNSNGLHQLELITHWKPTIAPADEAR